MNEDTNVRVDGDLTCRPRPSCLFEAIADSVGALQAGGTTVMRENEATSEQTTDLWTQLEDLLQTVRLAEANWRLDDRIDLAVRVAGSQHRRAGQWSSGR
jgi:hypothetical protein